MIEDGAVDLCYVDPGYEPDVLVIGSLRTMTPIWPGVTALQREIEQGRIEVESEPMLVHSIQTWPGSSTFSKQARRVS